MYYVIENLVLRVRSEMIGSAIDQICSWFSAEADQVSVNTESLTMSTNLVETEGRAR